MQNGRLNHTGRTVCYNHSSPTYTGGKNPDKWVTPMAEKVAQGYADHDMPRGWMLVNDGYGCEYTDLPQAGEKLRAKGVEMGLWTQRALTDQEFEVRTAGARVRKLDVAAPTSSCASGCCPTSTPTRPRRTGPGRR